MQAGRKRQRKQGRERERKQARADITFGSIGSRVRSTVDLLIDRPWKRERLIRQQAIPADNTRAPSVLSAERNKYLPPPAFVRRRNARAQNVTCVPALVNENRKDKVVSGNSRAVEGAGFTVPIIICQIPRAERGKRVASERPNFDA